MAPRLELQALLETILGSRNVYFQPPPNVRLQFPCIVYERARNKSFHADNHPYAHLKQYTVTHIGADPDSTTPDAVAALPSCSHDRTFTADNLNHDVFTLYF